MAVFFRSVSKKSANGIAWIHFGHAVGVLQVHDKYIVSAINIQSIEYKNTKCQSSNANYIKVVTSK